MNLTKLFEPQRMLDEQVVKEKGLEGQDLWSMKILSLQVELGELANEWRGFKFWSENREPRTKKMHYMRCIVCGGRGEDPLDTMEVCSRCEGDGRLLNKTTNPLLEEYVDCLHFILSIGLELSCEDVRPAIRKTAINFKGDELTVQFNEVMYRASGMAFVANKKTEYQTLTGCFIGLGEMLGFTWQQIEEAYYVKNKINHERQSTGY